MPVKMYSAPFHGMVRRILLVFILSVLLSSALIPSFHHRQHRPRVTFLRSSDDDADFFRDLEQAKKSKLGGDIPEEQIKEAKASAEQEFLAAMNQVKRDFKELKDKLGKEGATEYIIEKFRKEDEPGESDSEEEDENDDDLLGAFQ